MSSKSFGLFAFGIFALVFAIGMASAAIVLTPSSSSLSVAQGSSGSFTFTIGNSDGTSNYSNFTSVVSNFTSGTNVLASSNVVVGTLPSSLAAGTTSSSITITFNIPATQINATYNGTITIDADGSTTNPVSQILNVNLTVTPTTPPEITACNAIGNPGNLKVRKIDFANKGMQYKQFGEDDEWFPLEEIEAEIELKNDGADDIEDVSLEWGLYDTKNNVWVIELDEEDEFNIKDGDKEVVTVSFNLDDNLDVDLEDLTDGSNYKFYVVAEGTVDNDTAPQTCVTDFESASVIIESDFVVLNNFKLPETASCGTAVEVTADVLNIGDRDQDEVKVLVTNKELKLEEEVSIGDIDAFDDQKFSFSFTLPKDAAEKTYALYFEVLNEDSELYENDYDDDPSQFTIPLVVKGGCVSTTAEQVKISASLVSGGKAGQDLVVKATIMNNGIDTKTYTLNSAGHAQWASAYTVVPTTLTLTAGQSGEATFTFDVKKDVFGEQTFNIEVVSGNQVATQPVSVMIEKADFFSSITGSAVLENPLVWGFGILNIILIIVVILVAIRVSRK
jgi:hypothetical protein